MAAKNGGRARAPFCEPKMLDPTPELPDDTLISDVEFPVRIRNVLAAAGLKTVGEVREISDEILISFQDLGKASVTHLRETLGLRSTDGVRPSGKKSACLPQSGKRASEKTVQIQLTCICHVRLPESDASRFCIRGPLWLPAKDVKTAHSRPVARRQSAFQVRVRSEAHLFSMP
jgi:hypothetical protein